MENILRNVNKKETSTINKDNTFDNFKDYLKDFNIFTVDEIEIDDRDYYEEALRKHLYTLSDFSRIASNYRGIEVRSFRNNTGHYVEETKVLYRRYKRYIEGLKCKKELNPVEEFILCNDKKSRIKAKESLSYVTFNEYISILRRSMDNNEISIGNVLMTNIKRKDTHIQVVSLDQCSYNFMEMDAVFMIKVIRKRHLDVELGPIIEDFCDYNGLYTCSEKLIKALVSFPYEYFKWVNHFRLNRKELGYDEYLKKLKKAIVRDGDSLI
ncbi:hypothetical protein [Clostridium cellulovorans]|uniref:Spore coat protein n=1 Tax=Clostridium cellulovorans (strain ATCC 35296 / DSM 3052 / OCM 3 / 743B) TaxID=573061 RepID=D9SUA1_CLOC7|nr:hypothetical protein [Clostridium cellulovorans]ADL52856.1 hypothetical protein Clocel_3170 [Clostridium cellulovorans 743B]